MFTSRAEYRILLRQDNADIRLTHLADELGMQGLEKRMARVKEKKKAIKEINTFFNKYSVAPDLINPYLSSKGSAPIRQKVKLNGILLRPQVSIHTLRKALPEVDTWLSKHDRETIQIAEVGMKYEGYIRKEQEMVEKMNRLEEVFLKEDFNYNALQSLSAEAREKLTKIKPRTIGQASRISGVSPSDVSVLLVHVGR